MFKTVAAHLPADMSSPSIAVGRILPSLVQEQVDAKGAQLKSQGTLPKPFMPSKRQQTGQPPANSASRSILPKILSRRSQRPR